MTDTLQPQDSELLRQVAEKKDNGAFRILFHRYYRMVWSICRRVLLGREYLTEDAVQAVFMILFRHAGRIRNGGALSSWLFQASRSASIQILRAESSRQEREKKAADMKDMTADPVSEASWNEVRCHIDETIDKLPRKQRDAVVMHYLAGKSFGEISGETGIGRATVQKRAEAGLKKIRSELSSRDVAISVSGLGAMMVANSIEAVPAELEQTLLASIVKGISTGGSAAGSMVNIAAGAIGKMMFIAKMKVAATIAAAVLVMCGSAMGVYMATTTGTKDIPVANKAGLVEQSGLSPIEKSLPAVKDERENVVTPLAGPDWFAFSPGNDITPGVIGVNNWLDKPAGRHGMTKIVGDHFEFADGTKVKFWGTNLSYGGECCPHKDKADQTAARFAKYGVNGVRLHKFCGPAWEGIGDPKDCTKLTADGLDRLDYFTSKLTENGVYYGFSHTFGFNVRGNREKLLAPDELEKKKGASRAMINFAEDVQDLMIEMVVGLLKHRNPYTKKTYAEDPALSYVELQNEDDIFFFSTGGALNDFPTYKKDLMRRFSEWLKAKYGSEENLAKAWGDALKAGEKLEDRNIDVQGNPWFFSTEGLSQQDNNPNGRRRLLDNAAFFHDVQNKFYSKFVKAIRDAGYKGPLCGSPWQAPAMVPHYYNLKSDYLVGWIDRHDYAGGGNNGLLFTLLGQPGSGNLTAGLQQLVDRPFGISEWIHVYPSLYSAEGPALFAAYGMGLQGWDASYEFQSHAMKTNFARLAGSFPFGVWDADVPTQIGQFPTLSRMVLRGDVREGEIISTRRVSSQGLQDGKFDFSEKVEQTDDVKRIAGKCPSMALAAGRCVVEFTDKPVDSTFPDVEKYTKDKVITSTTGQLAWDYSGKGFFTINTDGTKAVVGFAEGREQKLGNVKITMQCPYSSVVITAIDKNATLADSKTALVSAVARNCNSGFTYMASDNRVVENGNAPILLEPVKAYIAVSGREIETINVIDFDGNRTGRTIEIRNGGFTIDGVKDKAIYYEIVFK